MFDIKLMYENLPSSNKKIIKILVTCEQPNKNLLHESVCTILEENIFKFMPYNEVNNVLLSIQSQINLCIKDIMKRKEDVKVCNYCMNQWISVNDKLPENFDENGQQEVLVHYQSGQVSVDIYSRNFKEFYYISETIGEPRVTHWMPLPLPPKDLNK